MTSPIEVPDVSAALAGIPEDYDPVAIAETKAKELSNPALFKFMSFLQDGGKTLPTEEVIVYTDLGTALSIQGLKMDNMNMESAAVNTSRLAFDAAMQEYQEGSGTIADPPLPTKDEERFGVFLPNRFYENIKKMEELQDKLYESRINFQVKGIPPRVLQVIEANLAKYRDKLVIDKNSPETINRLYDLRKVVLLMAACVVSYRVPQIEYFSDKRLSPQEAYEILTTLHKDEQQKIVDACLILTYAVSIADPRTEAGFLSRRAESTGTAGVPVSGESGSPVQPETVVPAT